MAKGWYILHVYSGYEAKIERTIRSMLEKNELSGDIVCDVKSPTETVVDVVKDKDGNPKKTKDGKPMRKEVKHLVLPGYLMLEMDLPNIGWKQVTSTIRRINGVTGFAGYGPNERPRPISDDEAKAMLQRSGDIKGEKTVRVRQNFEIGETIKLREGSWAGFEAQIQEISLEKNKAVVGIPVFGRMTPLEVELTQIEKI
ncbi:MAG: transcription termination/antitermination protein NusG [Treponemataceae bacterium]|nr:transcription termination/antitermination protein NusG [Treponemataceae bacterium]